MFVVLDTNVLVSALLVPTSKPAKLIELWHDKRFVLLTSAPQIEELIRVTRYPKISTRISPVHAGRMVNGLRNRTTVVSTLPTVDVSPDPYDNYLLSICIGGQADYLITGDKHHLLALKKHNKTSITSVLNFLMQNRF